MSADAADLVAEALDWRTLRAVASYLGVSADELERGVAFRYDEMSNEWCEWPLRRWNTRIFCSRHGSVTFGGFRMCAQHETHLLDSIIEHLGRKSDPRDVALVIQALAERMRRFDFDGGGCDPVDVENAARLHRLMSRFFEEDADASIRTAVSRMFGEAQ